ncbi:MAG: hypothetical protein R3Y04_04180 [Rikenellaceae bacterium]
MIDNNLINSGTSDIKINFLTSDENKSSISTLTIVLGLMGLAFGALCAACIIANLQIDISNRS